MIHAFENYPSAKYFKNKKELFQVLKELNFENCTILFKASRGMQFEKIVKKIN